MDLSNLVNLVLAAGAVAISIVAGLSFGSRKALRESNSDLRERISDLEKADARKTAEIAELQSRNEVLTSMVTGEVHWRSLGEAQDQLIRDAHAHWDEERKSFKRIIEITDRMVRRLAQLDEDIK